MIEAALTLALGATLLLVVLAYRSALPGALLAIGIAAYALGRQGILQLRAQQRRWLLAGTAIAVVAAAVLATGTVLLIVSAR